MIDTPEFIPTLQQMQAMAWREIRQHRNQLLMSADITINKLEDQGQSAAAWRSYRQQLRDLPESCDNPHSVVWPTKPA